MKLDTKILTGDCRRILRTLPSDSVHQIVTSPPYWGARDYQDKHKVSFANQIGREPSRQKHIDTLVELCREFRRVLRPDGTLWINYGDSHKDDDDVADKNILLLPERLVVALQDDGWIVRNDIVWYKINRVTPSSARDRFTIAHEFIYFMAKSKKYYFDAFDVREPVKPWNRGRMAAPHGNTQIEGTRRQNRREIGGVGAEGAYEKIAGGNGHTVWEIPTTEHYGKHRATFPVALAMKCIEAGTSDEGCCAHCGVQVERVTTMNHEGRTQGLRTVTVMGHGNNGRGSNTYGDCVEHSTLRWELPCQCEPLKIKPSTVLDPFGGSGTTGEAARRLKRNSILIDIDPSNAGVMKNRVVNSFVPDQRDKKPGGNFFPEEE